MGGKHYTKAEIAKMRRARSLVAKIDKVANNAGLIPGPYIKNETLKAYEEAVAAYESLDFHWLTDLDKPILEAYADAVAYWRFYKRKKDEALSKLGPRGDLIEDIVTKHGFTRIETDQQNIIAYCDHMIEVYFKRMMSAREHLSLTPIQMAKLCKAMQEIEKEANAKKESDPIEEMFGSEFKVVEAEQR